MRWIEAEHRRWSGTDDRDPRLIQIAELDLTDHRPPGPDAVADLRGSVCRACHARAARTAAGTNRSSAQAVENGIRDSQVIEYRCVEEEVRRHDESDDRRGVVGKAATSMQRAFRGIDRVERATDHEPGEVVVTQ